MSQAIPVYTQRCYVELADTLLRYKATQCDKHDLAKAVVLALSEAGIERHYISQAYDLNI